MSEIIIKPATSYKSRCPVDDLHSHAYPDPKRFQNIAKRYGIPLYGPGSVTDARENMDKSGVRRRVIKNFAKDPRTVRPANDFAIAIAQAYPGRLIPTGTIHPGYERNEEEVERLVEAGVRGLGFDSCWQKFHIDDSRLRAAYQKASQYGMFILTHTGIDLGVDPDNPLTWAENVLGVRSMAPDSLIIAAHLGANVHYQRAREYPQGQRILFDISWLMEMLPEMKKVGLEITWGEIQDIIYESLGIENIVYASDLPWADPAAQIAFWEKFFGEDWEKVAYLNAEQKLPLTV
ncbi:MAG: amidohydrolase family protein [bacterium]